MTDDEGNETMSTKEVCDALGISRTTLYDWMHAGRIQPMPKQSPAKRKEPLRFARADVKRLLHGDTAIPPSVS